MGKIAKYISACALATSLIGGAAHADFPDRPISIVVPFGAGAADAIARSFGLELGRILETDVVVINAPGAGGTIGTAQAAGADPDGYTLSFQAVGPMATQPHLRDLPYDSESWEYVCRLYDGPAVLMTAAEPKYDTLESVISAAKDNPGEVVYGAGPGSVPHLAMLKFADEIDADMKLLPATGGSADSIKGFASGVVDLHAGPAILLSRFDVTPLAIFGEERSADFPELPTMKELGHDVVFSFWGGIAVPKSTPSEIVNKLSTACQEVVDAEGFADAMKKFKFPINFGNPDEYDAFARSELEKYGAIIEASGLKK